MVSTPHFDRLAREGVLFNHAYVSTPSCNPSRTSVLTGLPFYRLKEASMNHTKWAPSLKVYTDTLAAHGYHVGYTGKGCMPTDWRTVGRKHNPAGPVFNRFSVEKGDQAHGMVGQFTDYARNFKDFLDRRPQGQPFCFWYGGKEPHRPFQKGIGLREGKKLNDAEVPSFYPDTKEIRSDLLDYAVHIEWFDTHLGRMIAQLEAIGELENTLIVVTGDNGMPFPRCKAACYEWGIHVPLAVYWGGQIRGARVIDDFVSFTDLAPTFLEAAGLPVPEYMTGKSLMPLLMAEGSGRIEAQRDRVVVGVERHFPGGRAGGWGYPIRAIRTRQYLYIRNLASDRWPAGDPTGPVWPDDDPTGGFGDVDGSPTKRYLCEHRSDHRRFYDLAFGKRPAEELYDVSQDPYQLQNLADDTRYAEAKSELARRLKRELINTQDPRALGRGQELDDYARNCQESL